MLHVGEINVTSEPPPQNSDSCATRKDRVKQQELTFLRLRPEAVLRGRRGPGATTRGPGTLRGPVAPLGPLVAWTKRVSGP